MTGYGKDLVGAKPAKILRLESDAGTNRFVTVDTFITDLTYHMIDGSKPISWKLKKSRLSVVEYPWMIKNPYEQIFNMYDPNQINARGGWFLPDKGLADAGWINLFCFIDSEPRFAVNNARCFRGNISLQSAEAVITWSLSNRIANQLFAPLEIRGPLSSKLSRKQVDNRFIGYKELLTKLNIDITNTLKPFLSGNGWNEMKASEKIELRVAFRRSLQQMLHSEIGPLYRCSYLSELIDRYYACANNDGHALLRRVITKKYSPYLVALFGGDWLGFLDYLGEKPHPDEEVIKALPSPTLYVANRQLIKEVASSTAADIGDIQNVAAALFAGKVADSPIEDRCALLYKIWKEFDAAHSNQQSGRYPLLDIQTYKFDQFDLGPYVFKNIYRDVVATHGGEYRSQARINSVLRSKTVRHIRDYWGTAIFERWPNRLYTALSFKHMVSALGPAFDFWNGVSVTIWHIAEDSHPRTDVPGIPKFYQKSIESLKDLGYPVDPNFFSELVKAESKLGPPRDVIIEYSPKKKLIAGQRRSGFHYLRDVVTKYRQKWAGYYLESYLDRWRSDLKKIHDQYYQKLAVTGRVPTLRQFSGLSTKTANKWFGGNLERVYAAIGEKALVSPIYERLMPENTAEFQKKLFKKIGGKSLPKLISNDKGKGGITNDERTFLSNVITATESAIRLIQIREATGEYPTITEFGKNNWEYLAGLFGKRDSGWKSYLKVIDEVLHQPLYSEFSSKIIK